MTGTARSIDARRVANSCDAELRLSTTPLSDPAEIVRQMPTQAISPALQLLEVMSSPILLLKHSPAGELREITAARPALPMAA
jgi:hypothetical protein